MQIFWVTAFLAGLALAADLNIWEVHHSCKEHLQTLQKAYDDAAELAKAAIAGMDAVEQPMPVDPTSTAHSEWIRVGRALGATFGFLLDKAGNGPTRYMSNVRYVFDRMNTALQGSENVPKQGYTGKFEKPLFACGDNGWQWIGRDDEDPNDPQKRQLKESRAAEIGGNAGAFVFEHRYKFRSSSGGTVGICRPKIYASTNIGLDMITWCTSNWKPEIVERPSPMEQKFSIKEGTYIETQHGLARIMVHEFAHWYGADGRHRLVTDPGAVSDEGLPLYVGHDGNLTTDYLGSTKVNVGCYFFNYVAALARNNDGGIFTGPEIATMAADAFAVFALMAYLDNYDWAVDGLAKPLNYWKSSS